MSSIKEPVGVDFFVESKPLSTEEKWMISDFIIQYKKENSILEKKRTKKKTKHSAVVDA